MREFWRRHGPPLNVAAVAIAASLGVDLLDREEGLPVAIGQVQNGLSIGELMNLAEVKPGCDPMNASKIIAQALAATVKA
jgi:hypothetical protein